MGWIAVIVLRLRLISRFGNLVGVAIHRWTGHVLLAVVLPMMPGWTSVSILVLAPVVMPGLIGGIILVLMVAVLVSLLNVSRGITHTHAPFVHEGMDGSMALILGLGMMTMPPSGDLDALAPLIVRRRNSVCAMTMTVLAVL